MKQQYQVILSLGTNQGDKLENILHCIQLITERIGVVIQVSKLYQTPSWGFESDPFYNCALSVLTTHEPTHVLELALMIEQEMGRIRKEQLGYQARSIDIDLIFFEDKILDTDTLQIPHPLLQERKFVLMPLLDLDIPWRHPILNQTMADLLENCSDDSNCVVVQDIVIH
ncbi:2-amino-4-hydroxy-6-hydroxymethyldihydropteridine diphosphokinase [Flavobacterium sp. NG2]|uniref:2-amino-4-hydroxy-6- hydroxymethyldihydropteridine diphosphokinase n=1 Tax=Flavobacterium sp. NG2 TaxID=3097547 RepID=UPI002A826804|nr:2-amino-4-hydroxy-6-hydroxymethyldihydropteridine diphosphokinase [Flavobacterium sp. NG2]WPR72772.1 2-amino-4-hydroxy-6-hydroxymethyldihydropteridine diphosphokinase [Flavobacterium sp. NG2]